MPVRVLVLLVFAACSAFSQSWDSLRELRPGDHVVVRETSGKEHKGEFRAYTTDTLRIASGNAEAAIERARVARVQVRAASRRVRHILIGAGIGLAIGIVVDQTLGTYFRNESGQTSGERAITYVAPIGIFGGIGAALPSYRTVYRAP